MVALAMSRRCKEIRRDSREEMERRRNPKRIGKRAWIAETAAAAATADQEEARQLVLADPVIMDRIEALTEPSPDSSVRQSDSGSEQSGSSLPPFGASPVAKKPVAKSSLKAKVAPLPHAGAQEEARYALQLATGVRHSVGLTQSSYSEPEDTAPVAKVHRL